MIKELIVWRNIREVGTLCINDGKANKTIVDPGGVSSPVVDNSPLTPMPAETKTNSSGGSLGFGLLFLLVISLTLSRGINSLVKECDE